MIVPWFPFNPVILMLHNTHTGRYHPILYWECPPHGAELGDHLRWKSKGHHTNGFQNRAEAVEELLNIARQQNRDKVGGDVYYYYESDVVWDGEDIPADVCLFNLQALTKLTADG